ncbi:MAG: hypothetical protein QOI59_4310 [Gammaproteobacteria bacterium]|jgi:hypothetical protein|nr:hypothetical protein [Gammaproteobacteria bacterium]
MRKQILTVALVTGCAGTTAAVAADIGANTTVGGQAFFDVSHIQLENENAAGKKIDAGPTGTGFDIKRLYLIADHKFNDVWSADITLDAQYSTASTATVTTPTGTTTALTNQNSSGGVTEVMLKKLYLEGKFSDALVVHAGSYTSPWAPFVESLYGYRYIEKTSLDRLGFAQTADWGLNATGKFGPNNMLGYSVSIVDGAGYKNPSRSKSPDYEGRISVVPVEWLTVGAGFYAGHLGQVTATNQDFDQHTAVRWDGVVGVSISGVRAGVEYFTARNFKTVNTVAASVYGTSAVVASTATGVAPSDKADGESAFISYAFNSTYSVFGRYDHTKLSKDVAPDLKDDYFNLGVAYKPLKTIDLALVYKNEKVKNGTNTISGADANGSYTIGGANGTRSGHFNEVGFYAQWSF